MTRTVIRKRRTRRAKGRVVKRAARSARRTSSVGIFSKNDLTRALPDEVIAVMQRIARRGTFADPNDPAS
jgi:hypothetical protein